jgi:hypothetical protein
MTAASFCTNELAASVRPVMTTANPRGAELLQLAVTNVEYTATRMNC